MANENARRDANRVTTALGVTNDVAQEIRNLLIDPATGALLVTPAGGGGGFVTAADSGLYLNGSTVQMGTNPLIENVVIDGDSASYSFTFTGLDNFDVSATTSMDLQAQDVFITSTLGAVELNTPAAGTMRFKTPKVSATTANVGDVAVLISALTGEWDWSAASSLVPSMICDADADTCVETERTADDDTIRFKAGGTDVLTATDAAFDVFGGVDINLSRDAFSGTYSVFNDATSPVIGSNAAGVAWTDADETIANFVSRQTGESTNSYVSTTSGITSKVSTNPSNAFISYDNTISFEDLAVQVGPDRIELSAAQTTNSTEIELTPFEILIDAKSKLFKLNEGTTATGTGAATNGMVLTAIDVSTGEAKYADAPIVSSTYQIVQTGGAQTLPAGFANNIIVRYDGELVANADFTLDPLTGIVTVNKAGTYRIMAEVAFSGVAGGSIATAIFRFIKNASTVLIPTASEQWESNVFENFTIVTEHTFLAAETFKVEALYISGNKSLATGQNRLLVTEL